MLFNSLAFIFAFLPITLLGYEIVGRSQSRRAVLSWLILCSVMFYGIWNPVSLAIIAPSIAINFALARWMQRRMEESRADDRVATWILAAGIAFNLCFLGYFKYKNFFLDSVNQVFGTEWPLVATILPLGISFITFQKIAFLVDVRSRVIRRFDALDFLIFVFFFPQLIAGPIVHYREMVPQFESVEKRLDARHLAVGLCLFGIGLFKKAVLADGIAPYATMIFTGADHGATVGFVNGWLGALAYTLQMYFDFSGYADMAIGLARMFGVRLPANFNSPLKASSMIDFWARWHMTLTRFLTSYVYTPVVMRLSRSRSARGKELLTRSNPSTAAFMALVAWPTIVTMGLSGLWHGAGVTFILWGLLHGVYLVINHGWRMWRPRWDKATYESWAKPCGFALTFVAVVVAMVLFRANTLAGAGRMLAGMAGMDGFTLPEAVLTRLGALAPWLARLGVTADASPGSTLVSSCAWVFGLLVIALGMPNSLQVMRRFEPALNFKPDVGGVGPVGAVRAPRFVASFSLGWAAFFGLILALGAQSLNRVSEFLYWRF